MAQEMDQPGSGVGEMVQPKRRRKLLSIFLIGLVLLLLGGGGGLLYLIYLDDEPEAPKGGSAKAGPKVMLPLEPFLVNLADRDVRHYLKVKVELEVEGEEQAKELGKSLARLRDALIQVFSSQTYQEAASAEGKAKLKQEILQRAGAIPGGKKVTTVYFTEFVAQ